MNEQIEAVALARGVRPGTLRRALDDGDARLVADVLGVDREHFERQVLALAAAGIRPTRAAIAAALGA